MVCYTQGGQAIRYILYIQKSESKALSTLIHTNQKPPNKNRLPSKEASFSFTNMFK
jgi:hypothetical protein